MREEDEDSVARDLHHSTPSTAPKCVELQCNPISMSSMPLNDQKTLGKRPRNAEEVQITYKKKEMSQELKLQALSIVLEHFLLPSMQWERNLEYLINLEKVLHIVLAQDLRRFAADEGLELCWPSIRSMASTPSPTPISLDLVDIAKAENIMPDRCEYIKSIDSLKQIALGLECELMEIWKSSPNGSGSSIPEIYLKLVQWYSTSYTSKLAHSYDQWRRFTLLRLRKERHISKHIFSQLSYFITFTNSMDCMESTFIRISSIILNLENFSRQLERQSEFESEILERTWLGCMINNQSMLLNEALFGLESFIKSHPETSISEDMETVFVSIANQDQFPCSTMYENSRHKVQRFIDLQKFKFDASNHILYENACRELCNHLHIHPTTDSNKEQIMQCFRLALAYFEQSDEHLDSSRDEKDAWCQQQYSYLGGCEMLKAYLLLQPSNTGDTHSEIFQVLSSISYFFRQSIYQYDHSQQRAQLSQVGKMISEVLTVRKQLSEEDGRSFISTIETAMNINIDDNKDGMNLPMSVDALDEWIVEIYKYSCAVLYGRRDNTEGEAPYELEYLQSDDANDLLYSYQQLATSLYNTYAYPSFEGTADDDKMHTAQEWKCWKAVFHFTVETINSQKEARSHFKVDKSAYQSNFSIASRCAQLVEGYCSLLDAQEQYRLVDSGIPNMCFHHSDILLDNLIECNRFTISNCHLASKYSLKLHELSEQSNSNFHMYSFFTILYEDLHDIGAGLGMYLQQELRNYFMHASSYIYSNGTASNRWYLVIEMLQNAYFLHDAVDAIQSFCKDFISMPSLQHTCNVLLMYIANTLSEYLHSQQSLLDAMETHSTLVDDSLLLKGLEKCNLQINALEKFLERFETYSNQLYSDACRNFTLSTPEFDAMMEVIHKQISIESCHLLLLAQS